MRFTGVITAWNLLKQVGEIETVSKQGIIFKEIHFAQRLTRQPMPGERVTFTLAQDMINKRWKANKIRFVRDAEPIKNVQQKPLLVRFIVLCSALFMLGVIINIH